MIVLAPHHLARIRAEAEAAWPEECCGLLIGADDCAGTSVERVVPARNVADGDRRRRFEIDPQALFDGMRAARDAGLRIVGHYHSHPGAEPVPSAFDLERAWEPGQAWLIIGVEDMADGPHAGPVRAWRPISPGAGFREIPLETRRQDKKFHQDT